MKNLVYLDIVRYCIVTKTNLPMLITECHYISYYKVWYLMSEFLECHYHYQGHLKQIGNQQGLQLNSIEPICGWETMQFI